MKKKKIKNINELSYKELGELYISKSEELRKLKVDSIDYNFAISQLKLIEDAIDIKSGNKIDDKIFVKVSDKAKQLGVSPRTIKNWIISGKVEGKVIYNEERKTWLVIDNIVLEEIKGKHVERERNSKGYFTKDGRSDTQSSE